MNRVILIGNLTRDPESGKTASDISYCKFSIAVSRRFSTTNEVDFLNIVCWRQLAENCSKYLVKGKKVAVSGSVQMRNYETPNGEKRFAVDIVADEVEFLSPASTEEKQTARSRELEDLPKATYGKGQGSLLENNDLPF